MLPHAAHDAILVVTFIVFFAWWQRPTDRLLDADWR